MNSRWKRKEDGAKRKSFLSSMRRPRDNPRLDPRVNDLPYKDPVPATHVGTLTLVPRGLWFLPSIPRTTMRFSGERCCRPGEFTNAISYILSPCTGARDGRGGERRDYNQCTGRNGRLRGTSSHVNTL